MRTMFGLWRLFSLFIICPFLLAENYVNMQLEGFKAETAGAQRLLIAEGIDQNTPAWRLYDGKYGTIRQDGEW